jgi:hypothetical protein
MEGVTWCWRDYILGVEGSATVQSFELSIVEELAAMLCH